ncbi:MAG: transglycosylase domain-containing protein [Candidatus Nanopelagicales bacterium]
MKIDYPRSGRSGLTRFVPSWKQVLATVFTLGLLAVIAVIAILSYFWFTVEIPDENEVAQAQTTIVYWDDAKTEMARIGDTNRISVPLSEIPEHTQQAVLAAEDRDFFEHNGFAVRGFARAVWTNLRTGSSQGGSTITQQYAKNAFLTADKTYARKINELILSLKLEREMSKDEILNAYLNTIFFGRGAYGIQTAAEAYFGVDSQDLTLEQSAVLAAIINSPGTFSPESNMPRLKERYKYVLNGMVEMGSITEQEAKAAKKNFPEIQDRKRSQTYAGTTGYLLSMIEKEVLDAGFSERVLYGGGLRIVSTFNQQAQKAAVAAVENGAPTINAKGVRIGLASVEPGTGKIRAIYGGEDYLKSSLNNATQAIGQAGSTFKPFALVAAIRDGISPWSTWPGNSPTTVNGYTFQNYGNTSYGESVSLLYGTQQSINSVFVKLSSQVGVANVRDAARDAGIPKETNGWEESDNLTFVLGTASPHPLDVAGAYATFAARGKRAPNTTLQKIEAADGGTLYKFDGDTAKQTIEKSVADRLNWYLQSVVNSGTGRPALALGRPAGGKTGSTDDYKSAWFAGYTPQLATSVMFIKDDADGNPVSLRGTGGMYNFYGGGYPARIWTAYMQGALQGTEVAQFAAPEGSTGTGNGSTTTSRPGTATAHPTATPTPTGTKPTGTSSPTAQPTGGGTSTAKPTPTQTSATTKPPTQEPEPEDTTEPTESESPKAAATNSPTGNR